MSELIKLLSEGEYKMIERNQKILVLDPTGHIVFITDKKQKGEAAIKRIKQRWSKTKMVTD